MAKLSFIKFFPQDYLYDTRILTAAEKGIWMDLLCFAWNAPKRGELNGTPYQFAQMVGVEGPSFEVMIETLEKHNLCEVRRNGDGTVTLVSRRMRRDGDALENNRLRVKKHRESHNLRQKKYRANIGNADVMPKKLEAKKLEAIKDKDRASFSFEEVWNKYPNKDGKKKAEVHFRVSVKSMQDFEDINSALAHYLSSERVSNGFIKDGSTWFNNWRDWIDPSPEMLGKRKVVIHGREERSILDGLVDKELRRKAQGSEVD